MAKAINMNAFNFFDDLIEHVYEKEITYIIEDTDIPTKVEIRDIFKIGEKYYMYIIAPSTKKGFVELDLTAADNTITEADTQTAAISFLTETLADLEEDDDDDEDNGEDS